MSVHLSQQAHHQLSIFKRQYFQLETAIRFPDSQWLRQNAFQQSLYSEVFSAEAGIRLPPPRYQLRILKELVSRIESSILDWNEEGISDDIMSQLSTLVSIPQDPEVITAQQKSYVTYTISALSRSSLSAPTITLFESRNLLAASGTTGFRTWEACLHLGSYLCSSQVPSSASVTGKRILELGAGTGYLSILCAKYLNAAHVTASDGFESVIADLSSNFYLNGLQGSSVISTKELKWGHALLGGEESSFLETRMPDLVLGADVTYDTSANSALVATFGDLFQLFPDVTILVAATIRNEDTWESFLGSCRRNRFGLEILDFPIRTRETQEGPFYEGKIPIQICRITKSK